MDQNASNMSTESSNSNAVSVILTACVMSAFMIYLVFTKNFVFGSAAGHWFFQYFNIPAKIPVWTPWVVFLLLGLSIFLGSKFIHSHEKITLLICFLMTLFIQIAIHQIDPVPLAAIITSDGANSFYSPAMQYSAVDVLAKFNELVPSFPLHARSNMPGKILLFEFLKIFTSSPTVMGFLIIILSSLGGVLLYMIAMRLFHDKQIAFYSLILYALIPCKIIFFPLLNTVTPLFILLCFYLFLVYIEKKQFWIAWLLGCSFYILILFEPIPLVTGIIFLGVLLHALSTGQFAKKDFWNLIIHSGLAFLALYIIFSVFLSFNLFQVFLYVVKDATNFNLTSQRPYEIWVGENIKEFSFGVGVPIMVIFIYMASKIFSQWKNLKNRTFWSLENIFVISILITCCTVALLGVSRGEATRIWIYLAVFFQIPTAVFMAKIAKGEFLFFCVAGILAIQSIIALHLVKFI